MSYRGDGTWRQKCRHDWLRLAKWRQFWRHFNWRGEIVTANRVIFAVTLFCRFLRMAFLPLFSGVVSLPLKWRSWRSIPFRRSFSCQGKKEAGTSKPAPAEFSFRWSKFDVPALYFTSAKKNVLMCYSVGPLTWEYSLPYRTDVCQCFLRNPVIHCWRHLILA